MWTSVQFRPTWPLSVGNWSSVERSRCASFAASLSPFPCVAAATPRGPVQVKRNGSPRCCVFRETCCLGGAVVELDSRTKCLQSNAVGRSGCVFLCAVILTLGKTVPSRRHGRCRTVPHKGSRCQNEREDLHSDDNRVSPTSPIRRLRRLPSGKWLVRQTQKIDALIESGGRRPSLSCGAKLRHASPALVEGRQPGDVQGREWGLVGGASATQVRGARRRGAGWPRSSDDTAFVGGDGWDRFLVEVDPVPSGRRGLWISGWDPRFRNRPDHRNLCRERGGHRSGLRGRRLGPERKGTQMHLKGSEKARHDRRRRREISPCSLGVLLFRVRCKEEEDEGWNVYNRKY